MEWAHQEGTVRPAGVPAPDTTRPTYADIDKGEVNVGVADRSPYLRSPSTETLPEVPHTPGSAIELTIYSERGVSLYEATSFRKVFSYLGQMTDSVYRNSAIGRAVYVRTQGYTACTKRGGYTESSTQEILS